MSNSKTKVAVRKGIKSIVNNYDISLEEKVGRIIEILTWLDQRDDELESKIESEKTSRFADNY
jgi:hypothetical protein